MFNDKTYFQKFKFYVQICVIINILIFFIFCKKKKKLHFVSTSLFIKYANENHITVHTYSFFPQWFTTTTPFVQLVFVLRRKLRPLYYYNGIKSDLSTITGIFTKYIYKYDKKKKKQLCVQTTRMNLNLKIIMYKNIQQVLNSRFLLFTNLNRHITFFFSGFTVR